MTVINLIQQMEQFKSVLLDEILTLWPKEQTYVDWGLPFCAGIKYLVKPGELGTYEPRRNQLAVSYITELPLDSLIRLWELMKTLRS